MADRKAKDGAPAAASAKARAGAPRKTAKPAVPALPVKIAAEKTAKPAAPLAKTRVQKTAPPPAAPIEVKAEAVAPAPLAPAVEFPAAFPEVAAAQDAVTEIQEKVTEGIKEMATKTSETVDAGKTAVDQAQAMFGDLNDRAKGVMEKNAKIVQEVSDLTKGNVEAVVASSRAAAKGIESLSREVAEYGRKSFEEASGALKSFAEVRSPADLFRLQSDYARSAFDSLVAETSKMSEVFVKLAGEVAEPITNRYSVAAERVRSIAL